LEIQGSTGLGLSVSPLRKPGILIIYQQQQLSQLTQRWASGIMPEEIFPPILVSVQSNIPSQLPLYLASVVPAQTTLWQSYPDLPPFKIYLPSLLLLLALEAVFF
jgi:hypothetical protein